MKKIIIGILDYGAGNCASVKNAINKLGFRTRLVNQVDDFNEIHLLLIPGVGAFPSAMAAINKLKLVDSINNYARSGKPIVGVCLGMQLLADCSHELGFTQGLGLIPGVVEPLKQIDWHIGWNNLEITSDATIFGSLNGNCYYFNHSFEFIAASEYVVGIVRNNCPVVAMVKKDNVCGLQFHPEKSQSDGLQLLKELINLMVDNKAADDD
jgi:glutamine amidotransferase